MSPLAIFLSLTLLLSSNCVGAALPAPQTGPVVKLSYGSFQGNATGNLVEFLGIPFAAPPYVSYSFFSFLLHIEQRSSKSVGNLRFALPKPPLKFAGVRQVTSFGAACPQQAVSIPGLGPISGALASSEDCRSTTYTYYLDIF